MAVKLEVVKPLENNRTEIKAYYNNLGEAGARSFSVPTDKKDEFISAYKKDRNKITAFSTIAFMLLAGLGGIAGGKLFNKTKTSRLLGILGVGLAGAGLSTMVTYKPIVAMEQECLNKYNVIETTPKPLQ